MASRKIQKTQIEGGSFKGVIVALMSHLSNQDLTEIAITSKHIWFRRNSWAFNSSFASPGHVSQLAKTMISDSQACSGNEIAKARVTKPPSVTWATPPPNFHKVNWDVAIDKQKCKVGIGGGDKGLERNCHSYPLLP